jgi:predicted RNase H-like HicB family nuclease
MSGRSKKPSRKKNADHLDRPFEPAIIRRAKQIAAQYRIILEPDVDVGFLGNVVELPLVWGDGKTADACVRHTREGAIAVVATMLELGEAPPITSREEQRTEQINIRVTPTEKRVLEEAARAKGFRGIADFVRSTTLTSAA